MNTITRNNEMVQAAVDNVRKVTAALNEAGMQPRFDIHFEGFGTGGTAGVSFDGAVRYLLSLASTGHANARYRAPIKSIEIAVHVAPIVLTA